MFPFKYSVSFALLAITIWMGYFAQRLDFPSLLGGYAVFFGLYWWVLQQKTAFSKDFKWWLGLGVLLRFVLLFTIPNLSDDYYRFLWDGHLTLAGIHPFAHPPIFFAENHVDIAGMPPDLFGKLNSPRYYSVYPPVCQALFALSVWLSPKSEWGGVLVLKLFLFVCEVVSIWLLMRLGSPQPLKGSAPPLSPEGEHTGSGLMLPPTPKGEDIAGKLEVITRKKHQNSGLIRTFSPLGVGGCAAALIYALNPLAILEITGNIHFEGAMICFMLLGIYALTRAKTAAAAIWWAFAVAAKLLPLMFLPLIIRYLGIRKSINFMLIFTVVSGLLFAPLLTPEVLTNMSASLDLYFQKFEFNASLYYIVREIGFLFQDYNLGFLLAPLLGLGVVGGILGMAIWQWPKVWPFATLLTAMVAAVCLQLFCASTVHPWYTLVPLALGSLTRWRFPVIWTGLAFLSYSHYWHNAYLENYWLIGLEYAVLAAFVWWETSTKALEVPEGV